MNECTTREENEEIEKEPIGRPHSRRGNVRCKLTMDDKLFDSREEAFIFLETKGSN